MFTIQTYTNTKCELEMAKTRLNFLMDKKEKLYCKYFPVTSKYKNIVISETRENNDKMADYLHELHELDLGTGMSLADEIEHQQKKIEKIQSFINKMNKTLSKMTGLEYKLYYDIVVNGTKISKAIDKIAETNNMDARSAWRVYKKIKNDVKKVIIFSKCQ